MTNPRSVDPRPPTTPRSTRSLPTARPATPPRQPTLDSRSAALTSSSRSPRHGRSRDHTDDHATRLFGDVLDSPSPTADERPERHTDLLRQYLDEIGRLPLASPEEECALARLIAEARELALELRPGMVMPGRYSEAAHRLREGEQARQRLVEANLRLVVSVAASLPRRGLGLLDSIQNGNLGLLHAVDRFDHRRGHRFSTYAVWWIRQAIQRGVAEQARGIRLPENVLASLARLGSLQHELQQILEREPLGEELAEAMGAGWTAEKVDEMRGHLIDPLQLDSPARDGLDARLGEFIPADADVADLAGRAQLRSLVLAALNDLSPRQADVLARRYGLIDGEEQSLEDIGRHYRLTRERIRQIERDALDRLRANSGLMDTLRAFLD